VVLNPEWVDHKTQVVLRVVAHKVWAALRVDHKVVLNLATWATKVALVDLKA
jgi:hypothetical protein